MGERLLAHGLAAQETPLNEIEVISAGVAAYPGDEASPNSVRALAKVGLNLNDHRSRRFSTQMLDQSLAIFVMTEGHREIILDLVEDQKDPPPILLFRELMGNDAQIQIPDPFGGPLEAYSNTRDALAEAIPSIIQYLKEQLSQSTD